MWIQPSMFDGWSLEFCRFLHTILVAMWENETINVELNWRLVQLNSNTFIFIWSILYKV